MNEKEKKGRKAKDRSSRTRVRWYNTFAIAPHLTLPHQVHLTSPQQLPESDRDSAIGTDKIKQKRLIKIKKGLAYRTEPFGNRPKSEHC